VQVNTPAVRTSFSDKMKTEPHTFDDDDIPF
jgi:hypothetical protein